MLLLDIYERVRFLIYWLPLSIGYVVDYYEK